jgi:uncharacterized membrane protein
VKADTHPEIRRYLAAVERAASGLPAARRRELLADLSEHIQVALAERPGALPAILAELGAPHDIAATALHEDDESLGDLPRRSKPLTTILLWTIAFLCGYASYWSALHALILPGFALVIAGLVSLWRSPWWSSRHKWTAPRASSSSHPSWQCCGTPTERVSTTRHCTCS